MPDTRSPASVGGLVAMAMRLQCVYPGDDCDRHRRERDFRRCLPCECRDEAERIDAAMPRPPVPFSPSPLPEQVR